VTPPTQLQISNGGTLRRRSQRSRMTRAYMSKLTARWLPPNRVQHPWPSERFDASHPRQEPSALVAPAGICAGGGSNLRAKTRPYRDLR
jgi:hypothetical protein